MRSFENAIYTDTPITAARVMSAEVFKKVGGYDLQLSGGPADWDFDLTLRQKGFRIGTSCEYIVHHEESLHFRDYVSKKRTYHQGVDLYKEKWRNSDPLIYRQFVSKQFSLWYRLVVVFIEHKKWQSTLRHFPLYMGFFITRCIMFWYY